MREAFESFNKYDRDHRIKCQIIIMDVKALYPSMKWVDIIAAVREMIENSVMDVQTVEWQEVGKYLAVMMTREEIEAEGLQHVIPKRSEAVRRRRKITI